MLQSHEDLIHRVSQPKMEVAVPEFLTSDGDPDFFFYTHFYNLFCGVKIKAMIGATDHWEQNLLVLIFKFSRPCSVAILDPNFIIVR